MSKLSLKFVECIPSQEKRVIIKPETKEISAPAEPFWIIITCFFCSFVIHCFCCSPTLWFIFPAAPTVPHCCPCSPGVSVVPCYCSFFNLLLNFCLCFWFNILCSYNSLCWSTVFMFSRCFCCSTLFSTVSNVPLCLSRPLLRLLLGDIGFVYPVMSMAVIGPSLPILRQRRWSLLYDVCWLDLMMVIVNR